MPRNEEFEDDATRAFEDVEEWNETNEPLPQLYRPDQFDINEYNARGRLRIAIALIIQLSIVQLAIVVLAFTAASSSPNTQLILGVLGASTTLTQIAIYFHFKKM